MNLTAWYSKKEHIFKKNNKLLLLHNLKRKLM